MKEKQISEKKEKGISRRTFLRTAASGIALAALSGTYATFIERYLVQTNTYRIYLPRLPHEFSGFKIAHLTDIHIGFLVSPDFVRSVIDSVNNLSCDMIVCTGDYVHKRNTRKEIDAVWPLLSNLSAPYGVYSVLGNHDHWADTSYSLYWLERTGQSIYHTTTCIEKNGSRLWLAGAGDEWEAPDSLDDLLKNVPPDECTCVLTHNPDTADKFFSANIDLMICGHTHGGQVDIPFIGTPVLPVRNKNYSSGLKRMFHTKK